MADDIKYIDVNLPDGSTYPLPDLSLDFSAFKYEIGDTVRFIEKTEGRDAALEHWSKTLLPHYGVFLVNLLGEAKGWSNQVKTLLEQLVGYAQASEKSIAVSAIEIANYLADIVTYQKTILSYKNTITDLEKTIEGHRKSVESNRIFSDETYAKTIKYDKAMSAYINTIDIYQNTILKYTQDATALEKTIRSHKEDVYKNKLASDDIFLDVKNQATIFDQNITKIAAYEKLIDNHKTQIYALELTIKSHKNQVESDKSESESLLVDTKALYYKTAALKAETDKAKTLSQQASAIATSHIEAISPDALALLKQANTRDFEHYMGFKFL